MSVRNNLLTFCVLLIFSMVLFSCSENSDDDLKPVAFGSVTDIDGNVYNTITIEISDGTLKSSGSSQSVTQTWMVENLKTTKYANGDPIPNLIQGEDWASSEEGAYCAYNNDSKILEVYGLLYNWYAVVDERNIAPEGWHVATESEWTALIDYLGGSDVAGGKLKEAGTVHWDKPNTGAGNSIGFNALPGGARWGGPDATGSFNVLDSCAYFWTSTKDPSDRWGIYAWRVGLYLTSKSATIADSNAGNGYSVRCLKDN